MTSKRTIRVYADTSVYGGVFDKEFCDASSLFFQQAKAGRFEICVSPVLEREISNAPESVRQFFDEMANFVVQAESTEEVVLLRDAYLRAGVVGPSSTDDALHVAFASVMRCSLLVSWNFKHIVHYDKIALYNAINIVEGYGSVGIHTPAEVVHYEG